CQHSYGIPLTF
nr:immunoglobulin light chain junction region [Macaca mulatta]MOX24190.1 immunoglobulin light chain junction region [Macaca mulatta]MOX24926.1 immunoglobulin light chain junction region [Macaca mulatta]MOX25988.1 immunoglobulin light chain junction region [Macaca mulatta]MOX26326.1 immunoglobulin light chain junction region [Macaca mulatta]